MASEKIRIRLKAYDYRLLDQSATEIVDTAQRTGARIFGPDPAADAHPAVYRAAVSARGQEVARAVRDPHAQAAAGHSRADPADHRRSDEARAAGRCRCRDQGLRRDGEVDMVRGILGKKVGMTQIFDDDGRVVPVTVVEAGPCVVVQRKSVDAGRLRGGSDRSGRIQPAAQRAQADPGPLRGRRRSSDPTHGRGPGRRRRRGQARRRGAGRHLRRR